MHPIPPVIADLIAASRRRELLAAAEARRAASLGKRRALAPAGTALVSRHEPRDEAASMRDRV